MGRSDEVTQEPSGGGKARTRGGKGKVEREFNRGFQLYLRFPASSRLCFIRASNQLLFIMS